MEEASPVVQGRPRFFPLNLVEILLEKLIQNCVLQKKRER